MPTSTINGIATPSHTTGYVGAQITCAMDLPLTRASASGVRPIAITGIALYLSGNGASRTVTLGIASRRTAAFSIANNANAVLTSVIPLTTYATALNTAATTSFSIGVYSPSGSYHFGRAADAGNNIVGYSLGAGYSLVGQILYAQVASQPLTLSLSSSGGNIVATWTPPSDNGGSTVTGYTIQYADNSDFTGAITTTSATASKTFVDPGGTTFVRVAAQNYFYSWPEQLLSPWSTTANISTGPTPPPPGTLSGMRWDGTQEVPIS